MPSAHGEPSRSSGAYSASSPTGGSQIFKELTFYFTIRPLTPNYSRQPMQHLGQYWSPPTMRHAYLSEDESLYRWSAGNVSRVTSNPFSAVNRESYAFNSATVFSQMTDTPHLLAVDFDAQAVDVRQSTQGWRRLFFFHSEPENSRVKLSTVSVFGDQLHLAGPGSPRLVGQLLPQIYDYQYDLDTQGRRINSPVTNTGLIGPLPILLALAAFSAPPNYVDCVLTRCVHPGYWQNHSYPSGHIRERGMVVKVYLDPANRAVSTRARLTQLQDGHFGPFYGS